MRKLDHVETLKMLAVSTGRPCMYISFHSDCDIASWGELVKAAPYLDKNEDYQMLNEGCGFIVFDNDKEMHDTYDMTVGDDGPMRANPYSGPVKVYALTCDAFGNLQTENT